MSEDVLIEKRDDGVALITLNRPESLNAMGGQLMPMLAELPGGRARTTATCAASC